MNKDEKINQLIDQLGTRDIHMDDHGNITFPDGKVINEKTHSEHIQDMVDQVLTLPHAVQEVILDILLKREASERLDAIESRIDFGQPAYTMHHVVGVCQPYICSPRLTYEILAKAMLQNDIDNEISDD